MEYVPYEELEGIHAGKPIVVAGTGPSLLPVADRLGDVVTIGINTAPRHFEPDYLLWGDRLIRMAPDYQEVIKGYGGHVIYPRYQAKELEDVEAQWSAFSRYTLSRSPGDGKSRSKKWNEKFKWNPGLVYGSTHAGYRGLSVAIWMGAKSIGMIGIDVNDRLRARLTLIENDFGWIQRQTCEVGVEIVNLSEISLIESVPKVDFDSWI